MKSLSINEYESEVIPSSELVRMMSRLNDKGVEITVGEVPPIEKEGWKMRMVGKTLLVLGSLYFAIHILVWAVK
jgi:hypothetical protein